MAESKPGRMIADLSDTPLEPVRVDDEATKPSLPAETPLRVWLGAAIIVLVGAAAFSATLGVPFHFEDRLLISENAGVHRIATVQEAFGHGDAGPVVWLVHALNWVVTPDSAASFHAVNLALHLANALLLYFICRLFIRPGEKDALPWLPLAAGLLFALHPVTTESVNYVVGRSGILAATFCLGAVLAFLSMDTGSEQRRRACMFAVLVCGALALGSHRAAWILPIILFVADWCRSGPGVVQRIPAHGLVLAATVAVAVATVFGGADTPAGDGVSPTLLEPPLAPQVAIARAADLSINRRPLSAVQSAELDSTVVEFAGNAIENFEPTNVIPGIALVAMAIVGGVVGLWFRQLLGLGLIWYAVALIFGAVWARNGMPFSERAVYFPVAGLAIAAAGALAFVGGRQRVRVAAGACVLILLSICALASFTRSRAWLDEQTLWELARDHAARSPVAYHRLAIHYGERGDEALAEVGSFIAAGESLGVAASQQSARDAFAKAAEYAQSAVEYGADEHPIRVLLGRALHMSGANEEAEAVLQDVLRADPGNRAAAAELARLHHSRYSATADREELALAADLYERAIMLGPPSYEELARYGGVLFSLGDLNGAQASYSRASQMAPGGPVDATLQNLTANIQRISGLEMRAGQLGAADPNDPNAPMAFALAAAERSSFMIVLYTLTELLESHPEFTPAWVTLGFTQARMGQADEFLKRYGTAPPRMPMPPPSPLPDGTQPEAVDRPPPWIDLATTCVRFNMWEEAAQYLLHADTNSGDPRSALVVMAELAREQENVELYIQFLQRATEAHPNDPAPWLMICDLSIQTRNTADADNALKNATERGAPAEELAARQTAIDALKEEGVGVLPTIQ